MKLTSLQKAKVVLRINFFILFVLIVVTPIFIQEGLGPFSEDTMEGVFLLVELLALVVVFWHYDAEMQKKEEEAFLLDVKLKRKEKELLSAFEYLGKVNVQVSMIKDLYEKMEIPSTKGQLRLMYSELLRIASSVTKQNCSILRVVNIKTKRMTSEYRESSDGEVACNRREVGSKDLIGCLESEKFRMINGFNVFHSKTQNFYIKAFILTPHNAEHEVTSEERKFLEAIANQCEIMFVLFNSQYYREK